jgi:hypothetical protein
LPINRTAGGLALSAEANNNPKMLPKQPAANHNVVLVSIFASLTPSAIAEEIPVVR